MTKILILRESDDGDSKKLLGVLEQEAGYSLQTITTVDRLNHQLHKQHPHLVLWDCTDHPPGQSIAFALESSQVPYIVVLRGEDWRDHLQHIRSAKDFVLHPASENDLLARIARLLDEQRICRASSVTGSIECIQALDQFIGDDPAIAQLKQLLPVIARTNASVLITGETGTGKELVARSLHYLSERRDGPLVPINCGAVPTEIFESELFGHTRGAFTGAIRDRRGYLEQANGGTLFLDELDAIPLNTQVKLLRVLQSRSFRRVGGEKTEAVDVRIIAASNSDLLRLIEQGRFRADLYYRLNIIPLHIPPLRERPLDIPRLANHFLRKYAREYDQPTRKLTADAIDVLVHSPWKGNVRELENKIHRLVVLTEIDSIDASTLHVHTGVMAEFHAGADTTHLTWQEEKQASIESFERAYLIRQLKAHDGNITQAANAAGTDRRVFGRMIKKYGLDSVAESARRVRGGSV